MGTAEVVAASPRNTVSQPLRQVLVKLASRCNLACDYCYVYRHADQTWRSRPKVMSAEVIDHLAERIRRHTALYPIRQLGVVFHGGEPLLAGPDLIDYAAARLTAAPAHGPE